MLDEPNEARSRARLPSTHDAARWRALELHLRAAAAAAERWMENAGVEDVQAARLAGMLHDIGAARAAFQDLSEQRTAPDEARPAARRFGAFAGKFAVDDGFLDPLPEAELTAWNGG